MVKCVQDIVSAIQGLPMNMLFRGQVNDEWKVQPTLLRNEMSPKWSVYESAIFDAWLKYRDKIPYPSSNDPFDYLATMQHFGAPTRLLDITSDIYTATFFACYDPEDKYSDKDGVVYIINKNCFHEEQLVQSKIGRHSKIDSMHQRLNFRDIKLIVPFEKNPRLLAQQGQFLCFPLGSISGHEGHYATLNEYSVFVTNELKSYGQKNYPEKNWELYNAHCLLAIKIDKAYKKSILQELSYKYGVTEQSLFTPTPAIIPYEPIYKYIHWWAMKHADLITPLIEKYANNEISINEKLDVIYSEYLKLKSASKETFEFDIPIIISSKE